MHKQQGQALVEMLVVVTVLLLLGAVLLWLQRWQQIKLQTQHHAALSAFRYAATHELGPAPEFLPDYLTGLHSPLTHQLLRQQQLLLRPQFWQPLVSAHSDALLGARARSLFTVQALELAQQQELAWGLGRPRLMGLMQVQSQTAIEVGSGAAHGAQQSTERLAAHQRLWRYATLPSQAAFTQLTPLLRPVDSAWSRADPDLHWLTPWQDSVPKPYLP